MDDPVSVAIYTRVSTDHQVDKDSLPAQRTSLIAYATQILHADSYDIFEDAGYSGKNTDRPQYQKMMSRVRKHEFTHVLVWKLDRISRNLLDFSQMYRELKKLGVTFVSQNEQFDTSTAMGEAMLKIILVFAELERQMTSERVTAVMVSRAEKGIWNGGHIPIGYDYDKETKSFSINTEEANVVLYAYELYELYHSIIKVVKTLNDNGYRTKNGNTWSAPSVCNLLKNPFYTGAYRYNRIDSSRGTSLQCLKPREEWVVIPDHHPAIISEERYEKVIESLGENRRSWNKEGKYYTRKNIHIFAGLLRCYYCGKNMPSTIDRPRDNGYRPSIYACTNRRRTKSCTNKYISDITLAPFVLNFIANIIKAQNNTGKSTTLEMFEKKLLRGFPQVDHIEGLEPLFEAVKSQRYGTKYAPPNLNPPEPDLINLGYEKTKLERALLRLQDLYLYSEESMSAKEYAMQKAELEKQLSEIEDKLKESQSPTYDDNFLEKASYFLLTQKLQDKRYLDYSKLHELISPNILRDFLHSVIAKICIKNGLVDSITFKNGINVVFAYKEENT